MVRVIGSGIGDGNFCGCAGSKCPTFVGGCWVGVRWVLHAGQRPASWMIYTHASRWALDSASRALNSGLSMSPPVGASGRAALPRRDRLCRAEQVPGETTTRRD